MTRCMGRANTLLQMGGCMRVSGRMVATDKISVGVRVITVKKKYTPPHTHTTWTSGMATNLKNTCSIEKLSGAVKPKPRLQ